VRAIGVHLHEVGVAARETPPERGDVGPAEALLPGPVQHVHPGVGGRETVREVPGAVGAGVVGDQHVHVVAADRPDDVDDVVPLVVRRDDDEGPHVLLLMIAAATHASPSAHTTILGQSPSPSDTVSDVRSGRASVPVHSV